MKDERLKMEEYVCWRTEVVASEVKVTEEFCDYCWTI